MEGGRERLREIEERKERKGRRGKEGKDGNNLVTRYTWLVHLRVFASA